MKKLVIPALLSLASTTAAYADTDAPDSHAPIGIMGDHLHAAGEFMVSWRSMFMRMSDNILGSTELSPEQIVSSVPNRFANPPMMPPMLRVVPTDMSTQMHMLGLMYAPSDRLTLMAMLNLVDKEMDHLTFQGPMGSNRLGTFTTQASGLGDSKLALLYGLVNEHDHVFLLNAGLSLPTGKLDATDRILTPMNTTPSPRLPYPMQLGSGTYDVEAGFTYKGFLDRFNWGSQLLYLHRLDENDESYTLGNRITWSSWGGWRVHDQVSLSLRLTYSDEDKISGIDPAIAAPVQTANPDFQGGERWDLGVGINTIFEGNHRVALEYERTIDQNANGVQMAMESMLTLGYQLAF